MNVTVEALGPCKKLLRFKLEAAEVDKAFQEVTGLYAKKARLPGFRPGKAPVHVIEKQYGKDIEEQVRHKLLSETYQQGIKSEKLDVLGYPDIEEIAFAKGQDFQFLVTIETSPEFALPQYRGLEAKRDMTRVSDADIEKALNALRHRKADFLLVDRPLQDSDIAVVDYKAACDGKPLTDFAPAAQGLAQKMGFWVEMVPDSFLPGFTEQLLGAKPGENRTVQIDFPEDFVTPELAGKHGVYETKVVEVRERTVPELDDAFAKSYGAETMETLRAGVRRDLQNELNSKQRRDIRNQLVRNLSGKVSFDLPESILDRETRNIVYEIVSENQKRGVPKEAIDKSKDDIYMAAKQAAAERVKVGFLIRRVADAEGIRTTEAEAHHRVLAMAQANEMTPNKLLKELEKRDGMPEIYQQLIHEKVVDFLQEHAKFIDIEPPSQASGAPTAPPAPQEQPPPEPPSSLT